MIPLLLVALHVLRLAVEIPVPVMAIVTASSIVYLGATRNLMKLLRRRPPSSETLTLSTRDAVQFPLWSACVLTTTYAIIKIFGKDFINYLLFLYLAAVGVYLTKAAMPTRPRLSWAVALGTVGAYGATKHWLLNNLIATCLAATALDIVSAGSFATAAVLLVGLFFYDIYFVFGTDVMVTVAKGIQGPVTLRFPRAQGYSMLGLGDVFVPGIFVSLLLRFDAKNAGYTRRFPKPFFRGAMLSYAAGLGVNYYVLYAYDTAQPALLYLVPATLGVALATAACKGQLNRLLAYCDDDNPSLPPEEQQPCENGASSSLVRPATKSE